MAGVPPPLVVGLPTRLRLVEVIGSGVSASVWRARDTLGGRDVAVKLLPPPGGIDDRATDLHRARFEREARALARLHGVEGVVALRELGITPDGTAWFVMDLAGGGSLRDRLGEGRVIDADALGLVLATALARAHELGVVHGDISPANVLFDEHDQPMLADFGMAALLSGGVGTDGVAGFTAAYAAPERLAGAPPDPASDVYALAATLWHAAHGSPPSGAGVGALAGQPAERPTAVTLAESLTARRSDPSTGSADADEAARGRRPFRRRR